MSVQNMDEEALCPLREQSPLDSYMFIIRKYRLHYERRVALLDPLDGACRDRTILEEVDT
jgi:hypothetical protein